MKKLVLIDSNAIIHRAYHALPANMKNSKGELTNAVYGFTTTLIKVLENLKPDYIAASFDVSKKTFRVEHYAQYKANRVKADQELYDQIPRVRELLATLNIPIYELEGYEADDVIGTIVKISQKSKIKNQKLGDRSALGSINHKAIKPSDNLAIYIVTGDKDLFQLVNGNVFVYSLKKGLSQMEIVDSEFIKKEYNLDPEDFIDLKALAGDASDNIPGVPHIGSKTATALLQKFDTLENLYKQIVKLLNCSIVRKSSNSEAESPLGVISNPFDSAQDKLREKSHGISRPDKSGTRNDKEIENIAKKLDIKPRILNLLIEHKDQAFLSQKLATIHRSVPINFNIDDCEWGEYDKDKLQSFFEEMQFRSLLKRFGAEPREGVKTKKAEAQEKKDKQLRLL